MTKMLDRPLDISDSHEETFRSHVEDLEERLRDHVSEILNELNHDELRNQIQFVVFEPNDALPKRGHYPPLGKIQHLVEQLYRSYDPSAEDLDALLRATIAIHEYYDIVDDVIDGELAQGHELEVFVTNELLVPIVIRYLGRLGQEAVEYWSTRTFQTVGSFVTELSSTPSATAYRNLVDRQSTLFGSLTGLGAVVAGEDETIVDRVASAGRAYFRYEQFIRDLHQYEQDDPDPWNAWKLMSEDDALAYVSEQREAFEQFLEELPPERAHLLCPLVAIDVNAFRESLQ